MVLMCLKICLLFFFLNVIEGVLDRAEGSECTVDERKGICINYQKCQALAVKLYSDYENTEVELCSFDGSIPIICCLGCDLISNISNLVFTYSGQMRWKTDQISREKCYSYSDMAFASNKCFEDDEYWTVLWYKRKECEKVSLFTPTAVGGRKAKRNEFPHMALLGYGERLISAKWLCGGSLISDRYILTAGHCTADAKLGSVKYAALGILRRSDPPQYWHRYEVKKIIPHPDYHSPSIYNDIALLELMTRIKFGPSVFPACLPFPNVQEVVGRRSATATGWGSIGSHKLEGAETLRVIKVKEFTEEECTKKYKDKRHMTEGYNHTTQMCCGDHYRVIDTCKGDSGGPLQIDSELCMYVVLGVTSSGTPCGNLGGAGLYTRVQHYLTWIEDIVWADEVLTKNDIWRDLILKKIEEKRSRSVRSSVAPGSEASSIRANVKPSSTERDMEVMSVKSVVTDTSISPHIIDILMEPDMIASSTESYTTIAKPNILKSSIGFNSTKNPDNNTKNSYDNILNQNDWVEFLGRHKNESVSKKTNEWIGTEIPDLESASELSSSSSSIKPDINVYDSKESDMDYGTDYSSYSDESNDWTKSLASAFDSSESPIEPIEISTEPDSVSTESDIKIKTNEQRMALNSGQSIRSSLSNTFELLIITVYCNLFLRL